MPYTFRDKKLNVDDVVICMIGAANRDPKAYTAPDEFNIYRKSKIINLSLHTHKIYHLALEHILV